MAESIIEIPRISIKPPTPKTETGLVVQKKSLITLSENESPENNFYCAGHLRIKNRFGIRENTFFISPEPPSFNPAELNTFMHGLDLTKIIPDLPSDTKPKYSDSHISALGHFELGRIEFTIDQPGIKNPFIPIGEKPVRSEKQNIIVYPYSEMARLVHDYQSGIMSGRTVDNNPNFDFALYRLTNEQLDSFKKQADTK